MRRAAAGDDGGVKGLVAGVPQAQLLLGVAHLDHLGQGVGAGEDLRLPGVVAALDGQAEQHRFQIGAGVVNIEQFAQRHRRHPVAALADRHHQALRHQLRQRFAQRADAQPVTLLQAAHQQLLTGLEHPANDVALQ
ncbi:hypothetical protein D3C80_1527020 [compost metagenome]